MFSSLSRRDPAGAGACEPEPCVRQRSPKNPAALAVRREAEEDWGGKHGRAGGVSELANAELRILSARLFFETTVSVFSSPVSIALCIAARNASSIIS
jgi:hypothetical protein